MEDKQTFSFEREDVGVCLKLVEAKGPGWEANVLGHVSTHIHDTMWLGVVLWYYSVM